MRSPRTGRNAADIAGDLEDGINAEQAEAEVGAKAERDKLAALVRDLTDDEPCWLDHHGGCQAHGYLSLKPGERCPQAEAKELLAAMDAEQT